MDQPASAIQSYPRLRRFERLRHALAEHNWLSVGIEILIVTIGVLLAFEIEQWGERRERASEERQLLERLYVENQQGIAELRAVLPNHVKAVRELGTVVRLQDQPERLAQLARQESWGCGVATLPSAPYNDTASEELIASGRLNLISDRRLRDQARMLSAVQQQGATQLGYARSLALIVVPPINRFYHYQLGAGPDPICHIDYGELVKDVEARNSVARAYRSQQLMMQMREGTLAESLKLQAMLACKLDKPECGPATSPPS